MPAAPQRRPLPPAPVREADRCQRSGCDRRPPQRRTKRFEASSQPRSRAGRRLGLGSESLAFDDLSALRQMAAADRSLPNLPRPRWPSCSAYHVAVESPGVGQLARDTGRQQSRRKVTELGCLRAQEADDDCPSDVSSVSGGWVGKSVVLGGRVSRCRARAFHELRSAQLHQRCRWARRFVIEPRPV